jgi:hypothetical protein
MFHKRAVGQGFALPTVLIASVVLLTILAVSVSATAAVRTTLKEQYYAQLAQIAGEAGVAYAKACLSANGNVPQWTNAKPLKPSTDCFGNELLTPQVNVLVVAGGGGGGEGGGGGGGVLSDTVDVSAQAYGITVGGGGGGSPNGNSLGSNGGNSSAFSLTAIGGGRGGAYSNGNGAAGGSGGGGRRDGYEVGGAGTAGQGFAGGNSTPAGPWKGGSGGGGAGGVGGNGTGNGAAANEVAGNGGIGKLSTITGGNVYYGAGGGGAVEGSGGAASQRGLGGLGGGGNGYSNQGGTFLATSGQPNSGSGGGGRPLNGGSGSAGNGGSGVVIVSYANNGAITATGGNEIYTSGIYKIHKFNGNGTFTVANASGSACPSDARCYVTMNDNIRSSFTVGMPTLDANGRAMTIPNNGYVEVVRESNGAVWRTYTQPSVQAAVVPDLCSGAATSSLGWNNAVRSSAQDSLSTDTAAQSITIASGNVNAGTMYFRKDFNVSEPGSYDVGVTTPSDQDVAKLYINGTLTATSNGGLASSTVSMTAGCHEALIVYTNNTIAPRLARVTAAIKQAGSSLTTAATDTSWRVSAGESVHFSHPEYYESSRWSAVRDVMSATTANSAFPAQSGDNFARFIATTFQDVNGNYPYASSYFRDTRDLYITSPTQVQIASMCDDSCTLYMNGDAIHSTNMTPALTVTTLQPGKYRFGMLLGNAGGYGNGFAMTVKRVSDNAIIARSDNRWKAANFMDATASNYFGYDQSFRPNPYLIKDPATASVMLVAGGGGGAVNAAGGGGGGGVLVNSSLPLSVSTSSVVVGAGGTGATGGSQVGGRGGNTTLNHPSGLLTALGGGGGAPRDGGNYLPQSGGSGGGGAGHYYGNWAGAAGTAGQGSNGGNGTNPDAGCNSTGGGGGGAGGFGGNGVSGGITGAGGAGYVSYLSGSPLIYGAGGAGSLTCTGTAGPADSGGGSSAALTIANRGGGGGAGCCGYLGGAGSSGIVIIAYKTGTAVATGGTMTSANGFTIHTFTSNGTFTVTSIP